MAEDNDKTNSESTSWIFDAPSYDPPYDSPIEDEFARAAVKHLDAGVRFTPQYTVETFLGNFRLDFCLERDGLRVGVECDGGAFHDPVRDRARDTLVLGTKHIEAIARLKGRNIWHNLDDCLYILAGYFPRLFSARGRLNLDTLASSAVREEFDPQKPFQQIQNHPTYRSEDEKDRDAADPNGSNFIPWRLDFELHNLNPTSYYYFMYAEFWAITKFHRLRKFEEVAEAFRDPVATIDAHFALLSRFSAKQREAYRRLLSDLQVVIYGEDGAA